MTILHQLADLFDDRTFSMALHMTDPLQAERLKDFISRLDYQAFNSSVWYSTSSFRKGSVQSSPFDIDIKEMYKPYSLTTVKDRYYVQNMFKAEAQLLHYEGLLTEDALAAACLKLLTSVLHRGMRGDIDARDQRYITLTDFNDWIGFAMDYISKNAPADRSIPFDIPQPIRPRPARRRSLDITAAQLKDLIVYDPDLTFKEAAARFIDKTGYGAEYFRKLARKFDMSFKPAGKRGNKSGKWIDLIKDSEWALDCYAIEALVKERWHLTELGQEKMPKLKTIKNRKTAHARPAIPAAPDMPSQAPDMKMPDIEYGRPAFDINDISLNAAPGPQAPPAFNPAFEEFLKEASAPGAPLFGNPDRPVLPAAPDNK